MLMNGHVGFVGLQENVTLPSSNPGTSVTCGNSNGDGTVTEILSDLLFDCHYLVLGLSGTATAGQDSSSLIDILGDPAGGTSYADIGINDLTGWPSVGAGTNANAPTIWYHFPVWIKSGTALAFRGRTNGASGVSYRMTVQAYGYPRRPDAWWCGQAVESLGITAASSKGTVITPGNSNAFSAYATIGTSTYRYGALQLGTNGSDATANSASYAIRMGVGSAQIPGTPTFTCAMTTAEQWTRNGPNGPLFVDIPASSTLQASAACNTTAEDINVAIYGVY